MHEIDQSEPTNVAQQSDCEECAVNCGAAAMLQPELENITKEPFHRTNLHSSLQRVLAKSDLKRHLVAHGVAIEEIRTLKLEELQEYADSHGHLMEEQNSMGDVDSSQTHAAEEPIASKMAND